VPDVEPEGGQQLPKATGAKVRGVADIVFCIDATASMTSCIEGVKDAVANFVSGLNSLPQTSIDWRVRLIGYRDLDYGQQPETFEFTTDANQFKSDVASLRPIANGDDPESTLDAIYLASRSEWRAKCHRFVVVFTDSPPKPLHHQTIEPGQANDVHQVAQLVVERRVQLFLFAPEDADYETLSLVPDSTYQPVELGTGLTEVNFPALLERIGKTVATTSVVAPQ